MTSDPFTYLAIAGALVVLVTTALIVASHRSRRVRRERTRAALAFHARSRHPAGGRR